MQEIKSIGPGLNNLLEGYKLDKMNFETDLKIMQRSKKPKPNLFSISFLINLGNFLNIIE